MLQEEPQDLPTKAMFARPSFLFPSSKLITSRKKQTGGPHKKISSFNIFFPLRKFSSTSHPRRSSQFRNKFAQRSWNRQETVSFRAATKTSPPSSSSELHQVAASSSLILVPKKFSSETTSQKKFKCALYNVIFVSSKWFFDFLKWVSLFLARVLHRIICSSCPKLNVWCTKIFWSCSL